MLPTTWISIAAGDYYNAHDTLDLSIDIFIDDAMQSYILSPPNRLILHITHINYCHCGKTAIAPQAKKQTEKQRYTKGNDHRIKSNTRLL